MGWLTATGTTVLGCFTGFEGFGIRASGRGAWGLKVLGFGALSLGYPAPCSSTDVVYILGSSKLPPSVCLRACLYTLSVSVMAGCRDQDNIVHLKPLQVPKLNTPLVPKPESQENIIHLEPHWALNPKPLTFLHHNGPLGPTTPAPKGPISIRVGTKHQGQRPPGSWLCV